MMSESDGLESPKPQSSGRQPQTQQPDPLKCPRCESTNTKFCYYNNYNKMQPRYFCRACKRHWTEGGTLRSVPIGGGRKNKRLRRPTNNTTLAIKNNPFKDQDSLPKDASFVRKFGSDQRRYDVESYIDIEELKGLVSWDFNGSFIGCSSNGNSYNIPTTCTEMVENDDQSTITTTSMMMPSSQECQLPTTSNFLELNNWNWKDLDTMVLDDLNKPWEDPTFRT